MKIIFKSIFSSIMAAVAIILAAAAMILFLDPFFTVILADNSDTVKNNDEKKIVILDAGHGGEDSGAVGINGSLEKELNLTVARIIEQLLIIQGYTVIMTREEDELLSDGQSGSKKLSDLKARVDIASNYPDAIFVSIHMNKFQIEKYEGLQVYYSQNHELSMSLAQSVQSTVKNTLQASNNRQIKAATSAIYVLHHIEIPAILVECGFLSNAMEEALLNDNEYQKKLAMVICKAITDWLAEKDTDVV